MKDRDATCFVSVCLCITVALLRMFAPQLPFDWMTLTLILAAAIIPILLHVAKSSAEPREGNAPVVIPGLDALHLKMAEGDLKRCEGDLPDALSALHAENPFAAMCAARGVLTMLSRSKPRKTEDAVIMLLTGALDAAAAAGEARVERETVDALFLYALKAMEIKESV